MVDIEASVSETPIIGVEVTIPTVVNKEVPIPYAWFPTVSEDGAISWTLLDCTVTPPPTANIKGANGEPGATPIMTVFENTDTSFKLSFNINGELYITPNLKGSAYDISLYTLPTASTTVLGGIKVDGVSITVDENGVASASGAVLSINGETGIVTLTKNHIGLNNVVNLDTSTTANITDSTDKRFVTDANLVVIGNTSGTNTGDETQSTITTKIGFTPLSKTLADGYYESKDSAIQAHIISITNPHSVTKNQVGLGNCDNTSDLNKPVSTATQTALDLKADKTTTYNKTEVDNAISAVVTSLDWKESVATYTDIATTYPTPEDGWTVTVKDTDETYRYNGTEWVSILTSTIPLASDTVDGKMSSTDFTKLSNITGTYTGDETNSTIKTKLGTDLSNKLEATNIIAGTNVTLAKDGNNVTINSTGGGSVTIDSALSDTSENPVQNKIVKTALDSKVNSVVNMGLSSNDFTNTLKTKLDGIAESANNYTLPTASTTVKGGIKVDGTSITVDENGVASASGTGGGLTYADVFAVCNEGVTTLPSLGTASIWGMGKAYIPASVTSMGDNWFYSSLVGLITGGGNLTTAGNNFAASCTILPSLSLPALTTAGAGFAYGCTTLPSLSLPALTTAGYNFVFGCPLTHLQVGGANTLTLTSATNNNYKAWKLPVTDMVAFGTALKTAATATALVFGTTYWNALSAAQKAIFTNKNYTVTTA